MTNDILSKFSTELFGQQYVWEKIAGVWNLRLMNWTDLEINNDQADE